MFPSYLHSSKIIGFLYFFLYSFALYVSSPCVGRGTGAGRAAGGDPVGAGEESGADAQAPFGSDTKLVSASYKQRHGRRI